MKSILLLGLAAATALSHGAVFVHSDTSAGVIPDGSAAGLARSVTFSEPGQFITTVEVTLNISPVSGQSGYLGDLYVFLSDGSNIAVLANRPGQDPGTLGGYNDDQALDVTFSDLSANDFHQYRLAATGDNSTALSIPLTGAFQPDGRNTDPNAVALGDSRDALLANFNGSDLDRTLSLFAADLSTGNAHQLNSWSLTITTIPEPAAPLLLSLAAFSLARRRRR